PTKLAHIVLRTKNHATMSSFYKTFLGAHAAHEEPGHLAFLTYDEEHHRIALIALPDSYPDRDPKAVGLEHFAFTFASLRDLVTAYQQRKERGIVPKWCINHGPTMSMYYTDPDGNRIETQVDSMTAEEANEYIKSDQFKNNPIGVEFDPDEIAERLDRGELEADIMKLAETAPRGMET
ncbi:Glyoxalase/Bleomycin resistance protein/Dihydroxybiphenyl dioxygenase, partial [Periconia macrospinosa]